VLTGEDGLLNHRRIASFAEHIHLQMAQGRKVIVDST